MKCIAYPKADLPHILYTPDEIDQQTPLPLIVFLHGWGERRRDLDLACKWGVPKYLDAGHDIPAIVYVPQCPLIGENIWVSVEDQLITGIDALQAEYAISKVHITGFSMGGHGTIYMAVNHPDRFTAIAPVATYMFEQADVTDDVCVLKDKAIWIFHSEADFVPVEYSNKVVENLRGCDATELTYTCYEDANHVETADLAYFHHAFYDWILSQ